MVEKKLDKYYWIAGVIGVTLIVIILAIIFIISPSFKSINKVSKELKENKGNLKVAEEKLAKLKEFKVKEDELREQSNVVYRAIPTKKEIGDIFIELNGLIGEAGGTGTKASGNNSSSSSSSGAGSSSSMVAPAGVESLTYQSEVTFPSYQNFKNLLSSSEKALRFVHLVNFKISGKDEFKVTLTYRAYYRGEQTNTTAEGQKQ
ncbi:MAG: hypothetical protein AAB632_02045 [Patescibacteria group bacterium]